MLSKILKYFSQSDYHEDNEVLDYKKIPVKTGAELIIFLNQQNRIRAIKRKVLIDSLRFEKMYLEPIHRFCELVQLMPASQAHHHSFAGGLIIHTLSVIEIALNERQKHILPTSSEPEIIEAQKSIWTYAVFIAALCDDVGKVMTMIQFTDCNTPPKNINIFGENLLEKKKSYYRIKFNDTKFYEIHQNIGTCFLSRLFDKTSLEYITNELDIFGEVLAYINNNRYDWGSVGNIVQYADQMSTSNALKIATNSRKFPGANIENFGERVMRTLRVILNNSSIPKNKAGAPFYTNDTHTFAVAKTFAELIREEMTHQGATDIPSDNTRIFDELQQQSFCETNTNGNAIFKVEIRLKTGFSQTFTVIKLLNKRLYPANKFPIPINGTIAEILHDESTSSRLDSNVERTATVYSKNYKKSPSLEQNVKNVTGNLDKNNSGHITETNDPFSSNENNYENIDKSTAEESVVNIDVQPAPVSKTPVKLKQIDNKQDHKQVVRDFFDWINDMVEKKNEQFIINRDGLLYVVSHENTKSLAMLSPKTFALFATERGFDIDWNSSESIVEAAKTIQPSIHNTKTNTAIAGKQVHYYVKVNSPQAKQPRLSFYLFPVENITNQNLKKTVENFDLSQTIRRMYNKKNK